MGLEDLEGCEQFFSKLNALASSLRYTSVFHQQQNIIEFMKHMDNFETYSNLSMYPSILARLGTGIGVITGAIPYLLVQFADLV